MPQFQHSFTVAAPLPAVAAFHSHTRALKTLTPPPILVSIHQAEALAEGSIAEFTLWFGPFPVRWKAVHSHFDPLHGFRDTQVSGPLANWQHTHLFTALDDSHTRVEDRIEYAYQGGWTGLWTRLVFNYLGLRSMFAYRAWATRRAVRAGRP